MTTKISEANIQAATLETLLSSGGGGPKISSVVITDSEFDATADETVPTDGGYIKILGSDFQSGVQVLIDNTPATSVTLINSSTLHVEVPPNLVGSYFVYAVNTDGGFAISVSGITYAIVTIPVDVFLWGGGGGGGTPGGWSFGAAGGAGGAAEGRLDIQFDQNFYITVGGGGGVNSTTSATGGGGIANRSGSDNRYGSGGGGFSGIFTETTASQATAVIIAGGGGGGGSSRAGTGNAGGAGGGIEGEIGYSPYGGSAYSGKPGTQSAAGAVATSTNPNTGNFAAALQGGTSPTNGYGGAGGGGYWGGNGGGYAESNTMGGGGGGSGYFEPSLVSNAVLYSGTATTPGNSSNAYRGTAGAAGSPSQAGSTGSVVLRYPDSYPSLSATGSPTVTVTGGYRIYTFTSSGSITF